VHLAVTAILLSTWTGKQVDQQPKLFLVRSCILLQKLSSLGAYISFFFLLEHYPTPASLSNVPSLLLFFGIIVSGCLLRVSTVCIQIAIEKDWVISISEGIEGRLTTLNISLRRVDLLCNLLSPLFITNILLVLSYRTSVSVLAAITAVSCIFELYWIGTVYEKFPQLQRDDNLKTQARHIEQETVTPSCPLVLGDISPTSSARLVGVHEDVRVPLVYLCLPTLYNCTLVRLPVPSVINHTHTVLQI
jgi:iron-regulated transporter 1